MRPGKINGFDASTARSSSAAVLIEATGIAGSSLRKPSLSRRKNVQQRPSCRRVPANALEVSVVRGLLQNFSFDELERPAKFLFETVRRNSVDCRRPALGYYAQAGENRLPAFRKEGFILHWRNVPARAEGGNLVRERLWY